MTDITGENAGWHSGLNRRTAVVWPVFLVIGLPLLVTVIFLLLKLFQHYIFFNSFDASIYTNLAWNIAHGNGFWSSILQKNHLGEHFSPIMALFAPLYAIFPSANVLMTAQGIAVGGACWLLLPLNRAINHDFPRNRQLALAAAVFILYLFYRPMVSALLCQFHPSTLGMPLLACAILSLHYRKNAFLAVSVLGLLLTKELAILSVTGLALYSWLVLHQRKTPLALGLTALLAAILVFKVIMPSFQEGEWGHMLRLQPFSHLKLKLIYLTRLIVPLALLPLAGWRALIPAMPLISLNLLVNFEPQFTIIRHYDDQASVFLIVSAIHGARRVALWVQRRDFTIVRRPAFLIPGAIMTSLILGLVAWEAATYFLRKTPVLKREEIQTIANSHRHLKKLQNSPSEVRLISHSGLAPYLCHRTRFMLMQTYMERNKIEDQDLIVFSRWRYPFDNLEEVQQYLDTHEKLVLKEILDSIKVYGIKPACTAIVSR